MTNKALYFTVPEIFFLIMQRELQGLILFNEIASYVPNDRDMAYAVVSLIGKGILKPAGSHGYQLSNEVLFVLKILENTNGVFIEQGYLLNSPMQCFYFYEGFALTVQMDALRNGYVRTELMQDEEAIKELTDYDFMPAADDFGEGQEDGQGSFGKGDAFHKLVGAEGDHFLPFESNAEELLQNASCLMVIDWMPKGAQVSEGRISVQVWEGKEYIVVNTKKGAYVEGYLPERFVRVFMEVRDGIG